MSNPKRTIKGIIFILLALMLAGYVLFQSQNILRGPVVHIDEPLDGATLFYDVVDVKGRAENVAYIYLNGRQIYIDNYGYFNEKLIAPPGYSIIELLAQDKFGRKSQKLLHLIIQKEELTPGGVNILREKSRASTTTNLQQQ